ISSLIDRQKPFQRVPADNALLEALLTTPEWLTGLSDDKEYDTYILCQRDIEEHIKKYLDTVSHTVKGEPHQQLLTTFLGKMVDLYTVMTYYFADAMEEVDRVAEDKLYAHHSHKSRLPRIERSFLSMAKGSVRKAKSGTDAFTL